MSLNSSFASKIYHARKASGLTQQALAELVSISLRWYQELEKGNRSPGAKAMLRLIVVLKIDPQDFREELGLMTAAYRFLCVKQSRTSPDLGRYTTYGLRIEVLTPSGYRKVGLVSDVSCDGAFVTALAERCTRLQLSPTHLLDVVLDALS